MWDIISGNMELLILIISIICFMFGGGFLSGIWHEKRKPDKETEFNYTVIKATKLAVIQNQNFDRVSAYNT